MNLSFIHCSCVRGPRALDVIVSSVICLCSAHTKIAFITGFVSERKKLATVEGAPGIKKSQSCLVRR